MNSKTITNFLTDPVKCAKLLGTAITVLTVLQTLNNMRVRLQSIAFDEVDLDLGEDTTPELPQPLTYNHDIEAALGGFQPQGQP